MAEERKIKVSLTKEEKVKFVERLATIHKGKKYIFILRPQDYGYSQEKLHDDLVQLGLSEKDFILLPFPLEVWEVETEDKKV